MDLKPLLILIAIFYGASPATAWDAGGHMLVAEIAHRHLKPEVAAQLDQLPPLLDARAREGERYNFVTAGPWMDDIKAFPKDYPWNRRHYVDLECSEPFPAHPPGGENAYTALRDAMATLRKASATPQARAEALAQVIHIVDDIHQPLHTASRHDRGGNGYLVAPPFRLPPSRGSTRPYNLHRFWDSAYRFSGSDGTIRELIRPGRFHNRPTSPGDLSNVVANHASALLSRHPKASLKELHASGPADFWQWVEENHEIAQQHGWPPGPRPRQHEVGRLTPEFVEDAHIIAQRRIVIAGHRLARLLNTLHPPPSHP